MKVRAICMSAQLLALVSPVALAQNNVTIYGRVDTSFDYVNERTSGTRNYKRLQDNASRLGFKGWEELGSGLRAVFGLEQGVNVDNGSATNPMYRNSYVGFTGGFGAAAMGRLDSAVPTGSPIYSLITANTSFVIHDAGATAIGTKVLNARNRTSNSVGYKSPELGGATFMARYALNGEGETESASGPVKAESDVKQLYLGVNYKLGNFGAGIGYGQNRMIDGLRSNEFDKKWMAVASYDFGVVKPYALYGRDTYNNTATRRGDVDFWLVGARVPVASNGHVTANYMEREVQSDRDGVLKKFQIGYGYNLSKRTMVYALHDREDPNSNVSKNEISIFSVGMQHNF